MNSGADFSVIGAINEDCAAAIITRLEDMGVADDYHVFAPVSYTHLDVYKRQFWTLLQSCRQAVYSGARIKRILHATSRNASNAD